MNLIERLEFELAYYDVALKKTTPYTTRTFIPTIPIVIGAFGTVTKGLLKGLEDLYVGGQVDTIQNNYIIENGQNTEKSPGDLRRLAVIQSPVKDHQLTLMWKSLMSK